MKNERINMKLMLFILFIAYAKQVSAHKYRKLNSYESEKIFRNAPCINALKKWDQLHHFFLKKHKEYQDQYEKLFDRRDVLEKSANKWSLIYFATLVVLYYETKVLAYEVNKTTKDIYKLNEFRDKIEETICQSNELDVNNKSM